VENETSTGLDYTDQLRERYRQAFTSVNSRMRTQAQRMKQRYDARVKECSFAEGEYVWYYVPRKKQGRNQKWRRLCEIFRVNRRFNDVLYQIQYSPRAKPILAHVDKLRRCESELPKRWKEYREISSGIASQSDQQVFARHASPTTGPNTGRMPSPTVSPTVVPVTCPTASPKKTDATYHRLRNQAERRQDVSTVKRSESELATRPSRPARVRRPPARFRTMYSEHTDDIRSRCKFVNSIGVRIGRKSEFRSDMATAGDNGISAVREERCGDKRRYKYYPRNEDQKAKRRAREVGSWTCERCDHAPFTSITGLQSHAVRLHGLHCDYRGHLSEFNNPARRRKMLRRVMQNGSAEQQSVGITTNLSVEASKTKLATVTSPDDMVLSNAMGQVTDDQSSTNRVDCVPSLSCRRCRFESPSPVPDAINWDWLEAVLNNESPPTTSTGNTTTAPMTTIDPSVLSCSIVTNAQKIVACETSQTENPVLVDSGMQTTVVQRSTRGSQTPC
jgi:hypothetical protein